MSTSGMFSTLRFQYKSKAFISLLSHMNHDAPDVLMLTLRCTEHPQCTELTLYGVKPFKF